MSLRISPASLPPGSVIAMFAAESLPVSAIRALTGEFQRRGQLHATETTSWPTASGAIEAVRWLVTLSDADDSSGTQYIEQWLRDTADHLPDGEATITVLPAAQLAAQMMIISDVDSTLINDEVIDELAVAAGKSEQVAEITAAAMRGELDFASSLQARVAQLAGLSVDVFSDTLQRIIDTAGAQGLLSAAGTLGWPRYAVSGGFTQVLEPLAERWGLTGFAANTLEVVNGELTGSVTGDVIDGAAKARRAQSWATENNLTPAAVVGIGDGANDRELLRNSGISVAFCAKPILERDADIVIRHRHLGLVGFALGLALERA